MTERDSFVKPNHFLAYLLLICAFALLFELGRGDIESDNEGQRAAPAAEMLRSSDYVIPTINGRDYLAKPPLIYWAIAATYKVTGVISPLTARIPSALSGAILILAVYFVVRKQMGEMPGRWAALGLLATPFLLDHARQAELDTSLALATFLSIYLWWLATHTERAGRQTRLLLLSGLCFGAAILLKGPVPFLFIFAAIPARFLEDYDGKEGLFKKGFILTGAAFVVELALKGSALLLHTQSTWLTFPYALLLAYLGWFFLAWRIGPIHRARVFGMGGIVLLTGLAVAAPWGIAVLMEKGWPYISNLLNEQTVERTHIASSINSGSPFFFLSRIPVLLAPWAFLFPLHFTKAAWKEGSPMYRFSISTGWLSVLVFSLIAGKESEYILPAVAFLLIATAPFLAKLTQRPADSHPQAAWLRIWSVAVPVVLLIAAVGGAIYFTAKEFHFPFILETWALTTVAAGVVILGLRRPGVRLAAIFASTLCLVVLGLTAQGFYYRGANSPRNLALLSGQLAEGGYAIESSRIYPAFAFYAVQPIPENLDMESVGEKLLGNAPYFYLTREKILEEPIVQTLPETLRTPLTPAFTRKGLVLIGNRPLPGMAERLLESGTPD